MPWPTIRSLLRTLTRRSRFETEMSDEMRFHIESRATDLMNRNGWPRDEALRQARIEFGSREKYKEHGREARGLRFFDELAADLRYAARTLFQNKGWTAVLVLSLALGIGANTLIFGVVNSLLLKTVPVSKPDELVRLKWAGPNDMFTSLTDYGFSEEKDASGQQVRTAFSYRIFKELQANNQAMTDLFAASPFGQLNAVVDGQAELVSSLFASGTYYRTLGVGSAIGRTFTPEDDTPQSAPVATISYGYWSRRFGKSPGVIGKAIRVANLEVTIVGVTPQDFTGVQNAADIGPDVTIPLTAGERPDDTDISLNDPTNWSLEVMGRLKPGFRLQQVEGNLEGVFQETARTGWSGHYAALTLQQRRLPRNQDRHHGVPRPLTSIRKPRLLRCQSAGRSDGGGSQHCSRAGAADRLRQCRQPAAFPFNRAAARDVRPALARRHAGACHPAIAHRKHPPGNDRRHAGVNTHLLGTRVDSRRLC